MKSFGYRSRIILFAITLMLPLLPHPTSAAENSGQGVADQLNALVFADRANEEMHHVSVTGVSGLDTIHTTVGELNNDYKVRYFEGKNSAIDFDIMHVTPNRPLTLEVEEIHDRSLPVLAYEVLVNGKETYFRTYQEASAGPNHYFLEVDPAVIGSSHSVHVTLNNVGGSRVNVSRVWAYSDFDQMLQSEGVDRPMKVGLFKPKLSWNNYDADLALLNKIKSDYGTFSMYTLAVGFDIFYMQSTLEDLHQNLDYLFRLSRDTGLPLELSLNSWWGGTPNGPDGLGGNWGDIPYNQVVYDPLNVNGRGNWQLTTPNQFGSTPWLSMNNVHYNEVRQDKIKDLTSYISAKTAEMQANHETIPQVVVYTENVPTYFPYFAYHSSPNGGPDFSPAVIADAAKDGVTLNPADGLSQQEQQWMVRNLTKYIAGESQAIASGFGHNEIVIQNGQITYPSEQLVENAYTHMLIVPLFPNWDTNQAAWERHMVKDIRFGGSWTGVNAPRYLDYMAARGRFADVNAERTSMSNFDVLPQAYAYGADHVTIYNYRNGDQDLIQAADGKANETLPTPSYEQSLLEYNFQSDDSLTANGSLVSASGVMRSPVLGNYVVSADNGTSSGGQLTFKVDNKGAPLSSGLEVELKGRAIRGTRVELWAGADPNQMQLVKTLTNFVDDKTDISQVIDKQASVAYFQIRLYSTGLSNAVYSWAEVTSVNALVPWDRPSGHANGFQYTLLQQRERNLWVEYRADVERQLDQYLTNSGNNETYRAMKAQYDDSRYVTVYHMLSQALSQSLPAKFIVKGNGVLGSYPLKLQIAEPDVNVHATLLEAGQDYKLSLSADTSTTVSLTLTHPDSAYYRAENLGGGMYRITRAQADEKDAVRVATAGATFQLAVQGTVKKTYPSSFTTSYLRMLSDGNLLIQSQDPAISEYVNVELKLADQADIRRGAVGASDDQLLSVPVSMLNRGDMLQLTLNDQQEVTSIKAYYGTVSGTITGLEPISITGSLRNAGIQIRDANGKDYSFEIGREALFDSPKATGTNILTANVDDLGFKVGDQVTVAYNPYTFPGREQRVLLISESYDTLVDEKFQEPQDGWRGKLFSATNVAAFPLDANHPAKVISPDNVALPGELVWKLDGKSPFNELDIQYSGRAILGNPDKQSVKWFVSPDNVNWTQAGMLEHDANEGQYTLERSIHLSDQVKGWNTVYVKCEIRSSSNTWGALNDVTIQRKAPIRAISSASLADIASPLAQGQSAPVQLTALYDNGDSVNLADAKVAYVISNTNVLTVEKGSLKALTPGTATVQAYVSVDGKVVVSNPLTVTVKTS